jgi:hypothetical protein
MFRKYKQNISGVTFWNISDRRSWLDNFPVRGRKDYPLLFTADPKPKKAYWEVVKFEKGNSSSYSYEFPAPGVIEHNLLISPHLQKSEFLQT